MAWIVFVRKENSTSYNKQQVGASLFRLLLDEANRLLQYIAQFLREVQLTPKIDRPNALEKDYERTNYWQAEATIKVGDKLRIRPHKLNTLDIGLRFQQLQQFSSAIYSSAPMCCKVDELNGLQLALDKTIESIQINIKNGLIVGRDYFLHTWI